MGNDGAGAINRANLLLAVASVLLFLSAMEVFLRSSGPASGIAHLGNARRLGRRWNALMLDCYTSNPRGYFDVLLSSAETRARYKAERVRGLEETWRDYPYAVEYRYNSAGYRGGEFRSRRRAPGVNRVVMVGDSFTEGQGVRESDTSVRVLERQLNRIDPGKWMVMNLGARGTDFPRMMRLFERAYELYPDVIVYGMVLNDPVASPAYAARWPRFEDRIMHVERPVKLGAFESRLMRFIADRVGASRASAECVRWYNARYDEPNREGWEQTQRKLRRVARTCRSLNVQLVVALWPLLPDVDGGYPFAEIHRKIRSFCEDEGITFHDFLPSLREHRAATLWVHPADHHPNEVAHALAANSLVPLIRDLPNARASKRRREAAAGLDLPVQETRKASGPTPAHWRN